MCKCGRPSFYPVSGKCRSCTQRAYREQVKKTGKPRSELACQHLDDVALDRAWSGEPVGRNLTEAERGYLVVQADRHRPGLSGRELGKLLGMDDGDAARFAARVRSGQVRVIPRNVLGTPAIP